MRKHRWATVIGSLVAAGAMLPGTAQAAPTAERTTGATTTVTAAARIIPASDFLTQGQIRTRLSFTRPLSSYYLSPTDQHPIADPDCATLNRPQATWTRVLPAARSRSQSWAYEVPRVVWHLGGSVTIYEYTTKARAQAALSRVKASVRSARAYTIVCEATNLVVSGQTPTAGLGLRGADFSWANRMRTFDANSCRHAVSAKGKRLMWVELCRSTPGTTRTPNPPFPAYPSVAYFRSYAQGAARAAL